MGSRGGKEKSLLSKSVKKGKGGTRKKEGNGRPKGGSVAEGAASSVLRKKGSAARKQKVARRKAPQFSHKPKKYPGCTGGKKNVKCRHGNCGGLSKVGGLGEGKKVRDEPQTVLRPCQGGGRT